MFKLILYGLIVIAIAIFVDFDPFMMFVIFGSVGSVYILFKIRKKKRGGGSVFGKGEGDFNTINKNLTSTMMFSMFMMLLNQNQPQQPTKLIIERQDFKKLEEQKTEIKTEKKKILSLFDE